MHIWRLNKWIGGGGGGGDVFDKVSERGGGQDDAYQIKEVDTLQDSLK